MKRLNKTRDLFPGMDIGDYTYGRIKIVGDGQVSIGKFCSLADGTEFLPHIEHHPELITTYPFPVLFREAAHIPDHPTTHGPIELGHDVWVGHGVTILSGVSIGNGCVIGAGSVVPRGAYLHYGIYAGNPARFKRFRFPLHIIERIEALKWWDWPIDKILKNVDALLGLNVEYSIDVLEKLI